MQAVWQEAALLSAGDTRLNHSLLQAVRVHSGAQAARVHRSEGNLSKPRGHPVQAISASRRCACGRALSRWRSWLGCAVIHRQASVDPEHDDPLRPTEDESTPADFQLLRFGEAVQELHGELEFLGAASRAVEELLRCARVWLSC